MLACDKFKLDLKELRMNCTSSHKKVAEKLIASTNAPNMRLLRADASSPAVRPSRITVNSTMNIVWTSLARTPPESSGTVESGIITAQTQRTRTNCDTNLVETNFSE